MEALEARGLAGAHQIFARSLGQDLDVAKNISAGKIGVRDIILRAADGFDHAAIDDEKDITRIAGRVNGFPGGEMPRFRKLANRFQFEGLERNAKAKEIPVDHGRF
jgi:hypothetical protein